MNEETIGAATTTYGKPEDVRKQVRSFLNAMDVSENDEIKIIIKIVRKFEL